MQLSFRSVDILLALVNRFVFRSDGYWIDTWNMNKT